MSLTDNKEKWTRNRCCYCATTCERLGEATWNWLKPTRTSFTSSCVSETGKTGKYVLKGGGGIFSNAPEGRGRPQKADGIFECYMDHFNLERGSSSHVDFFLFFSASKLDALPGNNQILFGTNLKCAPIYRVDLGFSFLSFLFYQTHENSIRQLVSHLNKMLYRF